MQGGHRFTVTVSWRHRFTVTVTLRGQKAVFKVTSPKAMAMK